MLFLTLLIGSETAMSSTEIPAYKVIVKSKSIEVREYAPLIQAEVTVAGERKAAINAGFRLLADYIFGNNEPKKSIAMTAPVTQQKGAQIAMTAPVTQIKEGDVWRVQFTMPSSYSLETLPKPNNTEVKIISKPACRTVSITFSGFWSNRNMKKNSAELEHYIKTHEIKTEGEATYSFYNPPWTLPFFRRNEISYKINAE